MLRKLLGGDAETVIVICGHRHIGCNAERETEPARVTYALQERRAIGRVGSGSPVEIEEIFENV